MVATPHTQCVHLLLYLVVLQMALLASELVTPFLTKNVDSEPVVSQDTSTKICGTKHHMHLDRVTQSKHRDDFPRVID